MASKKDIDRRIKSVKNTKKITYAMKLVSAAKLKKTQVSVVNARSYTESLAELLSLLKLSTDGISPQDSTVTSSLVTANNSNGDKNDSDSDLSHPLLAVREVKNILLIVIGGARGLAGGYNSNLNKKTDSFIKGLKSQNEAFNITSILLSKKPAEYYRRIGRAYLQSYEDLSEDPLKWPLIDIGNAVAEKFASAEFDEVYLVYTKFKSAMSSVPVAEKVLPLTPPKVKESKISDSAQNKVDSSNIHSSNETLKGTKVLFEPSPKAVFAKIVPQVFKAIIMQACLDAKASELASRMTAMDAATKNAGELITKLTLLSNKLRQQKITSELLDIIGGAEAVA